MIIAALGTVVRLQCPDPMLRAALGPLLDALATDDHDQARDHDQAGDHDEARDHDRARSSGHRPGVLDVGLSAYGSEGFTLRHPDGEIRLAPGTEISATLRQLNFLFISRMPYFGAHAAVLGGARGAVVLPGRSGLGKSTATAAGLLAGLGYLSDEALAVDWHTGSIAQPYPRPMALSDWSRERLGLAPAGRPGDPETGEQFFGPTDLTARISPPREVSDVVLLGPFGDRTELRPATRSEAAAELLRRSFNAWQDPAAAFRTAHRLAAGASCWFLDRGRPAETGRVLREVFGSDG